MRKGSPSSPPQGGYNTRSKMKKGSPRTMGGVVTSEGEMSNHNQDEAAAGTGSMGLDLSSTDDEAYEVTDYGASHVAPEGANDGASGGGGEHSGGGAYDRAQQGGSEGASHGTYQEGGSAGVNERSIQEVQRGYKHGVNQGAQDETDHGAHYRAQTGGREGRQPESCHVTRQKTHHGMHPWWKSVPVMAAGVAVLIAVVIAVGLIVLQSTNTDAPGQPDVEPPQLTQEEIQLNRFQDKLLQLMAKFPEQHHRFWRTLSATTKRIIKDVRPIQPGVILIGSTHDTRREADCIARLFSQVVTEVFESKPPIDIDVGSEYLRLTPEDAKVAMEMSLMDGFGAGAQSAVISHLEEMHGTTGMLLHAFCDNDNAPFTKVVILLTLHTEQRRLGVKDDAKVEEHLSSIWQRHLNIDDVSALLTRVANNVIIPRNESETVLKKYC